jgi:CheY-like chemotaxis protein
MITDINLGSGMDGVTLGRLARTRFPDLPVIYISGRYGDWRGLSNQERFLLKPFPPAVLVRTLRELSVATARDLAF